MKGDTVTARILALCNQKGGVGKSTTTFHLARAAVLAGRSVLAVDLDPQETSRRRSQPKPSRKISPA